MKKTLVSALTTALVVGAASTTFAAANPFADVPADHWAYDAVTTLAADGVINGYVADGTFKGDNNMTRYEMAQIVAKALTKTDGMSAADKAMLDKLAAEFSDELANLGVRVAALENKVDNVKWKGLLRYQYKSTDNDGSKTNASISRLRLEPTMMINEHWSGHARIDADLNVNTDAGSADLKAKRVWAQGDYDNFSVKLGKFPIFDQIADGMIVDTEMTGVDLTFGKQVKLDLIAGRASKVGYKENAAAADLYRAQVSGQAGKLGLGAAYYAVKNTTKWPVAGVEKDNNVWEVAANYKFSDDWKLAAAYAKSDLEDAGQNDNSYNAQLYYKAAKASKQGSYGLSLAYRQLTGTTTFNPTWDTSTTDQKGWALNAKYTVLKNVQLFAEYFKGKKASNDTDLDVFYGKVDFLF